MPFKKRNRKQQKERLKESKNITKRLMEISICVDNYIYKHVPITIEEAKTYAQEISCYKTKCSGDTRTLQVIDKLTRFMKNIVEETPKIPLLNNNISVSEKGEVIVTLPNSFNNEDLEHNRMVTNNQNAHQIVTTKNIPSKNFEWPKNNAKVGNKNKTKIYVQNGKSQKEELNKITVDEQLNSDPLRSGYNAVVNTQHLQLEQDKTDKAMNVITETMKNKLNLTNKYVKTTKIPALQKNKQRNNKQNHISELIQKPQQVNNSFINTVVEINTLGQVVQDKKKKRVNKRCVKKENISTTAQTHKKPKNLKISNENKKTQKINSTTPYQSNIIRDEVSFNTARNKTKPEIKITDCVTYNKLDQNLAWVNDIKYVREVAADEYDLKLNNEEENFWGNFLLPAGWSDVEFLY